MSPVLEHICWFNFTVIIIMIMKLKQSCLRGVRGAVSDLTLKYEVTNFHAGSKLRFIRRKHEESVESVCMLWPDRFFCVFFLSLNALIYTGNLCSYWTYMKSEWFIFLLFSLILQHSHTPHEHIQTANESNRTLSSDYSHTFLRLIDQQRYWSVSFSFEELRICSICSGGQKEVLFLSIKVTQKIMDLK